MPHVHFNAPFHADLNGGLVFPQVPRIFGKLILFISILKPFLEKSPFLIVYCCILLPLAHALLRKKDIQVFGLVDMRDWVSKNTFSETKYDTTVKNR